MGQFLLEFFLFIFVMLGTIYWHLWYKLGPSLVKDIAGRLRGKKKKIRISNPEIEKFLKGLNYRNFYVVDSVLAYGMAQPLSKEVILSSKIYNGGNTNLIKYVFSHEIAHKRQGNTKWGVVFFTFWIIFYLLAYAKLHLPLSAILIWAFVVGRIARSFQRRFEDMADREAARILGKENTAQAIKDIFILNKTPLSKRSWWWDMLMINRDYPGRMKAIGYN